MKRTLASIGLAALAVGVLAFVALNSRPMPPHVHIAQNHLGSELGILLQDHAAIVDALEASWESTQPPGEAAYALVARLRGAPERISRDVADIPGSGGQRAAIEQSFLRLIEAISTDGTTAAELLENLGAYTTSVAVLRDVGPQAVQRLRDLRLDGAAATTFELVMGTIDYATTETSEMSRDLQQMLITLERDRSVDANMPREMSALGSAVETVLASKRKIEELLEDFRSSPIPGAAAALETVVNETYQANTIRIDRARLMLAAYALALLVAVSLITYRLRLSYNVVAKANAELSRLNESLESRVAERTEELETALADLKESQVQLVQAEKMSSLGQLVAGISHEINTPLLYLANNISLIQERLQVLNDFVRRSAAVYGMHPDDFESRTEYQKTLARALNELSTRLKKSELSADLEDVQDLLGDCADGLKDLTDMAQSLKDFSRLDRAPVGNFDVNSGLDKTLVIAKNMIKHKANVTKCYGEVPEIECSPSQINQVFLNLITNAAQAIDESGEIVLKTSLRDDQHIAVSVSDSGCGIPEEILDKITDPFFTTKEVGSGTGLGLSIVDEIVRNHGGELLVESKVGVGSKFTVILPIKSAARGSARANESLDGQWPDDDAQPVQLAEAS